MLSFSLEKLKTKKKQKTKPSFEIYEFVKQQF